jgi:hypothetical protein
VILASMIVVLEAAVGWRVLHILSSVSPHQPAPRNQTEDRAETNKPSHLAGKAADPILSHSEWYFITGE